MKNQIFLIVFMEMDNNLSQILRSVLEWEKII